MALCVYEASLDPKLRPETEKLYGSGLSKLWNQLHELSMELRKYYKPLRSTRKDIVTTLDKIYAIDLPINLSIFQTVSDTAPSSSGSSSSNDKPEEDSAASTANPPCEATASCEAENNGNDATIYDADWLLAWLAILT